MINAKSVLNDTSKLAIKIFMQGGKKILYARGCRAVSHWSI